MTNDLTLYHSVESTCAQKVRLVLSEKRLAWRDHLVNLRKGEQFTPEYLKLNPKAVVPTLVHGDAVVRESTVINEYLDDVFPEPALKPADPHARANMRLLVKAFDDEVHPAVGILTYAVVLRHQMNALKSPEELEAHFERIADPQRRERQRGTHQLGLAAPHAKTAVATLDRIIGDLEAALASGPWLAGASYSLADAAAVPYVVRMGALQLEGLWAQQRPRVRSWLARARDRDNARRLTDPWGSAGFAEMFAGYATLAQSEINGLLESVRRAA
jgi:glutathione S-transferase